MKLFGVSLQESQGDDDGSSDNENLQKTKQVADDSVEAMDTRGKEISNESISKSTDVDSATTRVDDRKKKRVADDDDAVDEVLPLKKRLFRADDQNVSEQQSEKEISNDSTITRVDDRKKKRVADVDDAVAEALAALPLKWRLRSSSQNISEQQRQSHAAARFHPRVLEAIGGNKPPSLLFVRRVDSVRVFSQGDASFNDRCYLVSYAQISNELSQQETSMLRMSLLDAPVRVVATDQRGVDYEFELSWEGVSVAPWEWVRLVAENGLKEIDTVEGYVYWLGGQFRLALSISRY